MKQDILLFISLLCLVQLGNSLNPIDKVIDKLAEKINAFQVLKPRNATPPFTWYEKKGLFRSDIRLNFVGNPVLQQLRNGIVSVFDNDMFSSGWIVTCLLEASIYGKGAPLFDKERLDLALSTLSQYNNKNDQNNKQSVVRAFWEQVYNETSGLWYEQPTNIRNVVLFLQESFNLIPWKEIESFLKVLGLKKLETLVEEIQKNGGEFPKTFLSAFSIPPDFDDTYLNLGLGATLSKLNNYYPELYASWLKNNSNIDHLVDVTVKYAYDPFSQDLNKNLIDPRTYFYAREFLQQAAKESNPVHLITTWVQNVEEQHTLKEDKISMPFNLNNIDVTVGANFVYGVTAASIYNTNGYGEYLLNSTELQTIYLNTTKFISWAIKSNFSSRPDLAQVYYPSRYNFLWYASRSLFLINNELVNLEFNTNKEFVQHFNSIKDILSEAKFYLEDAYQKTATDYLFNVYNIDKTGTYFCDFLGENDTNVFGKPEKNTDDCLFSTAQAINIIIATWTYQDAQTKQLIFKDSTPSKVKSLLLSTVNWLERNILDTKHKKLNAFFSGSVKGFSDLPFWYPSNYMKLLNGTDVDPTDQEQSYLTESVIGVSGLINENDYQNMLKQKHFNVMTPVDFRGYNSEMGFPFWSSEAYTYAVSLLALAQYNNLRI